MIYNGLLFILVFANSRIAENLHAVLGKLDKIMGINGDTYIMKQITQTSRKQEAIEALPRTAKLYGHRQKQQGDGKYISYDRAREKSYLPVFWHLVSWSRSIMRSTIDTFAAYGIVSGSRSNAVY